MSETNNLLTLPARYEGIFILYNTTVPAKGNTLSLIFEAPYSIEEEQRLIPFRGVDVKARITQQHKPEDPGMATTINDEFKVYKVDVRMPRGGYRLRLILTRNYDKVIDLEATKLKFDSCKVSWTPIQSALPQQEKP